MPLEETLRDAAASHRRICLWGPYRVRPEFAQSFRDRVARVESSFRYKGACFLSPTTVCDCTRSLEEMVGRRRLIGAFGYGAASSSVVVRLFEPWLIDPWQTDVFFRDRGALLRRPSPQAASRVPIVRDPSLEAHPGVPR